MKIYEPHRVLISSDYLLNCEFITLTCIIPLLLQTSINISFISFMTSCAFLIFHSLKGLVLKTGLKTLVSKPWYKKYSRQQQFFSYFSKTKATHQKKYTKGRKFTACCAASFDRSIQHQSVSSEWWVQKPIACLLLNLYSSPRNLLCHCCCFLSLSHFFNFLWMYAAEFYEEKKKFFTIIMNFIT